MAQIAGSNHICDRVNPRSRYLAMSAENLFIPIPGRLPRADGAHEGVGLATSIVTTSLAAAARSHKAALKCYCHRNGGVDLIKIALKLLYNFLQKSIPLYADVGDRCGHSESLNYTYPPMTTLSSGAKVRERPTGYSCAK